MIPADLAIKIIYQNQDFINSVGSFLHFIKKKTIFIENQGRF